MPCQKSDKKGFLTDTEKWTEEVAQILAQEELFPNGPAAGACSFAATAAK